MSPGYSTPLLEQFRRGEVDRELRLDAASASLPIPGLDQLVLLMLLATDPDPEVCARAIATLAAMPTEVVGEALSSPDATDELREFAASRGIERVVSTPTPDGSGEFDSDRSSDAEVAATAPTSSPVMDRLKLAIRGGRHDRAKLIRDRVRVVAVAVLSSPKLTEQEVESFVRMSDISEEVLRIIGNNRAWLRSYAVLSGLVRNPRTPISVSLRLIPHLKNREVKMLAIDRNVPDPVRAAARRRTLVDEGRRT